MSQHHSRVYLQVIVVFCRHVDSVERVAKNKTSKNVKQREQHQQNVDQNIQLIAIYWVGQVCIELIY